MSSLALSILLQRGQRFVPLLSSSWQLLHGGGCSLSSTTPASDAKDTPFVLPLPWCCWTSFSVLLRNRRRCCRGEHRFWNFLFIVLARGLCLLPSASRCCCCEDVFVLPSLSSLPLQRVGCKRAPLRPEMDRQNEHTIPFRWNPGAPRNPSGLP